MMSDELNPVEKYDRHRIGSFPQIGVIMRKIHLKRNYHPSFPKDIMVKRLIQGISPTTVGYCIHNLSKESMLQPRVHGKTLRCSSDLPVFTDFYRHSGGWKEWIQWEMNQWWWPVMMMTSDNDDQWWWWPVMMNAGAEIFSHLISTPTKNIGWKNDENAALWREQLHFWVNSGSAKTIGSFLSFNGFF